MAANISVAIFFLMSGLVLTRGWSGDFPVFLARRFIRLWPVFAVCLGAGALLAWHRPPVLEFFWIPFPRYDANLLCPPMWSLFIEAWAALAMPAIVWSARGGAIRTLGCMAACVVTAVVWHPADLPLRAFLSYLVCFVAGAGLSRAEFSSPVLEHWLRAMARADFLQPVSDTLAGASRDDGSVRYSRHGAWCGVVVRREAGACGCASSGQVSGCLTGSKRRAPLFGERSRRSLSLTLLHACFAPLENRRV